MDAYREQMEGLWFLCSLLSFLCVVKDRDGDGKHIGIRSGWLDAALDFHNVIKELLWLTLSLTSVWQEENGSQWLQRQSYQEEDWEKWVEPLIAVSNKWGINVLNVFFIKPKS